VIREGGYKLCVVDTFSRIFTGDQNDVSQVTPALAPLQEVAQDIGMGVLLTDHHNKLWGARAYDGSDSDAAPLDPIGNLLGSTAKGAMCDTAWGLYRCQGKRHAVLATGGRDGDDRSLALNFDGLTYSWQVEGDADAVQITKARRALMTVVEDLEGGTCKEIADALEHSKGSTYGQLQDLLNAGLVQRKGNIYSLIPSRDDD